MTGLAHLLICNLAPGQCPELSCTGLTVLLPSLWHLTFLRVLTILSVE